MDTQNSISQSGEASQGQGPVGGGNYKVKQGDCIESIAYKHGFFWETLWNLPENDELRRRRQDPNILFPGDEVFVPDKREKTESCATEKRHRFRKKGVPAKLIIRFKVEDEPRANEAYFLEIDGMLSEGQTDGDGEVEIFIPPDARKGKISFRKSGDEYELDLGDLDPITELSGVQGRLMDLGFYSGPVDGKMSEKLEQAIHAFQEKNDLEPTGTLDENTRSKIEEAYGG